MLNDPRSRPKICLANGTHRAEDVTACFPPSLMGFHLMRPKSPEREENSIALVATECWKNGNQSQKRRLRPLTTFHELPLARRHQKLPRLWEITPQLLEVGEAFHLNQLRPLLLAQQFNVAEQLCLPSPSRVRLQESHQRGRSIDQPCRQTQPPGNQGCPTDDTPPANSPERALVATAQWQSS